MPRFGQSIKHWEKIIELAIEVHESQGRCVSGYEAEILLRERYIDTYEIMDLDSDAHPWPLIADGPRDGLRELWGIEARLSEFELYEINKYYGYNFTQFIQLPRHLVELILNNRRAAEKRIQDARKKAEEEAKRDAQNPDAQKYGVDPATLMRGHMR